MARIRRTNPRSVRRQAGFNLVELVVVVIILGVIMAAGSQGFAYVVNSGRVTNPANELLSTLQYARMESVRRNARVVVCRSDTPNALAPACTTATGAWAGWLSFVDTNRNGALDAGEVILRVNEVRAPVTLLPSGSVSGASQSIVFRPDGMARADNGALLAAQMRVCLQTTVPSDNFRDVVIASGSRMSVVRGNGNGTCPVVPDSAQAPTAQPGPEPGGPGGGRR